MATGVSPLESIINEAIDLGYQIKKKDRETHELSNTIKAIHEICEIYNEIRHAENELKNLEIHSISKNNITEKSANLYINQVNEEISTLIDHLSTIILNKDLIVKYLQQPFSDEYIVINHEYHEDLCKLLTTAASNLKNQKSHLKEIEWANNLKIEETPMMKKLANLLSLSSKCENYHDTLTRIRNIVKDLKEIKCKDQQEMFNICQS